MEDCVLIDHRYYRIKPGLVPAHLDIYEKHGFALVEAASLPASFPRMSVDSRFYRLDLSNKGDTHG